MYTTPKMVKQIARTPPTAPPTISGVLSVEDGMLGDAVGDAVNGKGRVGNSVDDRTGATVGEMVGDAVGDLFGATVGEMVRNSVGVWIGATMGGEKRMVGACVVGERVTGAWVGVNVVGAKGGYPKKERGRSLVSLHPPIFTRQDVVKRICGCCFCFIHSHTVQLQCESSETWNQ